MSGLSRRRGIACVILIAALALVLSTVPLPSRAANPPSGTVSEEATSVAWQGALYVAAATFLPEECPAAADPANVLCDHFFLTVDVAPDFWDHHAGGVTVTIAWASDVNDFDLYVFNEEGSQIDSSAAGGTTSEQVFLEFPAPGVYEIRVVPFLVVASDYQGSAVFAFSQGPAKKNPTHRTGGIAFSTPVVVDPQRTEGEPIVHVDGAGNLWESGPWGTSTAQSFVHKSVDGGDSFHVVSAFELRPDPPPGGGDTDIVTDEAGNAYFVDLEGLVNLGVAVSHDGGNTWRKNAIGVEAAAVDRQWYAMDLGPTSGAADNTLFLTYNQIPGGLQVMSSPGSTGPADPVGGLVFVNAADRTFVAPGSTCGQTKFDSVHRNLYLVCLRGDHVEVVRGLVRVGQRTGIHFDRLAAPASPGGQVGDIFPAGAVDAAGTLYVIWVDENDHNVYLSGSRDEGATWSAPIQVNGHPANTNAWTWAAAGAAGLVDVMWLGTELRGDPDAFPNWFVNRPASSEVPWFVYFAQVRFDAKAPARSTIYQMKATPKPVHFGQICQGGLGCTTSGGDRSMADFIAVAVDASGAAHIVYDDTTNQHHGAAVFSTRQIAGPGVFGTTIAGTSPTNPMPDPAGDAQVPHFAPGAGAGPNVPAMDFLSFEMSQPSADVLRVRMRLADARSLLPPPAADGIVWLARWQAAAPGDGGEASFRIFYVGARSMGGGPPSFFSGTGTSASPSGAMGNGCVTTTPQNCKLIRYPAEGPASGSLDPATGDLVIDVARADVGLPKAGDVLLSVTGLSFGELSGDPVFLEGDATRGFDFALPKGSGGAGGRVAGSGTIRTSTGGEAAFAMAVGMDGRGKIAFVDDASGVVFHSAFIRSVSVSGSRATIEGMGFAGGQFVSFRVVVEDLSGSRAGRDTFAIEMSTGYREAGALIQGDVRLE